MKVTVAGLPADHPDAAPIQALVERIVELTQDQTASVVLSSLFSLYRHGLMQHPQLHETAIKHLLQVSDELMALKSAKASEQPTPAVATARPAGSVELALDEVTPEMRAVVERLAPFINSQGWPHHQVLPALFFIFFKTALAHPCCLATSVKVLRDGAELLGAQLQSMPASEHAGQALH